MLLLFRRCPMITNHSNILPSIHPSNPSSWVNPLLPSLAISPSITLSICQKEKKWSGKFELWKKQNNGTNDDYDQKTNAASRTWNGRIDEGFVCIFNSKKLPISNKTVFVVRTKTTQKRTSTRTPQKIKNIFVRSHNYIWMCVCMYRTMYICLLSSLSLEVLLADGYQLYDNKKRNARLWYFL